MNGVLVSRSATFTAGQEIELLANFPSDQAFKQVEFFEETSEGVFTPIGSDESNHLGNAYFEPVTVKDEGQDFYARTPDGKVTQLLPLKPTVVLPADFTVGGTLTMNPATAKNGATVYFLANFPSGTFDVTLYEEKSPGAWSFIGVERSNMSGNAYFHDFEVTGSRNVFALASTGKRTEVDTVAPTPEVSVDIERDCTGNDCADSAMASGVLDPVQEGRVFKLEYLNGSSWTQVGSDAMSGVDGRVEIPFSLTGLPQWETRTYRLTSGADASSSAVTSHTISFMPGLTELGVNVLRVDVDKGVFPVSKSTEHIGTATLSENGDVKHQDLALENFEVRGTSTANFPKKPYKLKFLNKPPKVNDSDFSVFGMERHKSWSLLANWLDRSNVRDKVGLELGRRMTNIAWTPDSRYVELFVNDEYRGAYLLTESVKIDDDRVAVDENTGMIMETDGFNVQDSSLGFRSTIGRIVFLFEDPDERKGTDPSGITKTKYDSIRSRINSFEKRLYSSTLREGPLGYAKYIDIDSAIDFYLVKEFTKDQDADFHRSNYFWWDPEVGDGKFHFGPAWDFDRSAGVTSEPDAIHRYIKSPNGFYLRGTGTDSGHPNYNTHWFVQLFKSKAFRDKVDARWLVVRDDFAQADDEARAAAAELGIGAENDRHRWVGPRRYEDHGTYEGEVDYVAGWYDKRYVWINDNL